jgi:hypothetical protein
MFFRNRRLNALCAIFVSLGLLLSACQPSTIESPTQSPPPTKILINPTATQPEENITPTTEVTPTEVLPDVPASSLPIFATFKETPVDVVAAVEQPAIAPDLSNVYNPFALSQDQITKLGQNGFVVSPGSDKEFYTLYEMTRYDNKPIFVSSDSMLHVYHLLFDKVLRTAERKYFIEMLSNLNQSLLAQTDQQYQALKGTAWEEAALHNVAFVGVASRLLDPTIQVPEYAADLVQSEVDLVNAAAGTVPSPLFPGLEYGEDYTQYIPRGHYTLSDDLKAYFKSMMWYGRMTFRLKTLDPEFGRAETRAAILLVNAIRNAKVGDRPALDVWQDLYSPTAFFVGRSDDLTVLQYGDVFDAVFGKNPELTSLVDETKLDKFIELAYRLPPPKILGIVISDTADVEQSTKGLRFMGQRFVPDAYVFRELMYRNVGTSQNRRGLPKAIDFPAAMGSERALQLLDQMGETKYENYTSQMEKMRTWLSSLGVSDWTETLYNSWLYCFYPLLDEPTEGYPAFMQSVAWLDKQLNTVLGSFTELKHDTILYAKQAYAERGGGPPPPPPAPPRGYVEPVPEFYARLASLAEMTRTGLSERGYLDEQDSQSLERLETLVRSLQTMAEKELRNEPLTAEEYELIRYIGGDLEHLTMAAADSDSEDPFAPKFVDEDQQAALVADIATDPGAVGEPQVLEEGIGNINQIHVVVPIVQADGTVTLEVAKGGVFSYYEFPWPASDRLTDEKWRQMLDEGNAPDMPEWTASFFTEQGEYSFLTSAVFRFQDRLTSILWDPMYVDENTLQGAEKQYLPQIKELNKQRQYMGHQWLSSEFRSIDLQSDTKAVVTVREQWLDTLRSMVGEYADTDDPTVGQRGPYFMDATYTLEFQDGYWQVTNVVYNSEPPEWTTP